MLSPVRIASVVGLLLLTATLANGCRSGGPPPAPARHALNEEAIASNDDLAFDSPGLAALERALIAHFGPPARPRYLVLERWREQGFDPNRWGVEGAGTSLPESAALFRDRCARCHGQSGGVDGRMSNRFITRPRDYRSGMFKRTPLANRARPRHEDLVDTLSAGIPGTAMPAWAGTLTPDQIAGLARYVRLLAIRGETERLTILDYDADDGLDLVRFCENYELALERWRRAGDHLIVPAKAPPDSSPERIARGRALFRGDSGSGCVRCHGDDAHGDGPFSRVADSETGELVPFQNDWGDPIRPRDLVCATLRFGDRPIDLFRRIYAGINGTPMPAHGALLAEDDIWDLVLFVLSLRELSPGQGEHR